MNAVFKVIYNEALKVFQAVNEMTRSRGKRASSGLGGQTAQSSGKGFSAHLSGVAASLVAAGFMGAAPASAAENPLNVVGSITISGEETYDGIQSEQNDAVLQIDKGGRLVIQGKGTSTFVASLKDGSSGGGELILDNSRLKVTDNDGTNFSGTIRLQNGSEVDVVHLTGLTGTGTGTIVVDDGSKLIGDGRKDSNFHIQVNAKLSGENGRIVLTQGGGSSIKLSNAANDFRGFFSLKNGSLEWTDGAAKFFSETETEFTDVNLVASSDVTFKSLKFNGESNINLRNGNTLAIADNKPLTLSGKTYIYGSGIVNALLTGGGSLLIGDGVNAAAVTLSATGPHTYDGNITVDSGSSLHVAGDISSNRGIEVAGTLNMEGDYQNSSSTITIKDGGKATFNSPNAVIKVGTLNVESGGTLNLQGYATTGSLSGSGTIVLGNAFGLTVRYQGNQNEVLKIGNVFEGNGDLHIHRTKPGKVVFEESSDNSEIGLLTLSGAHIASSNAGEFPIG